MSLEPNKLLISSDFYSVQGEGITSGVPSYFVRLSVCNLACGMSTKFLNQIKKDNTLADGEIFVGDLHAEGKATWTCDSTSQWAIRGVNQEYQYLIDRWNEQGLYDDVRTGLVHVIWTGGEPTIKQHQQNIVGFHNHFSNIEHYSNRWHEFSPFYEIETNGTNYIDDELMNILDQINCSPKLANSGMTIKQRIAPHAIERIMEHDNYQFKFVISTEDDVKELFEDFVEPFNIPLKNVVCMPGLDDQADFHERTQFVLEMAKKYKFIGLTRLHISAWDKTLNV